MKLSLICVLFLLELGYLYRPMSLLVKRSSLKQG